MSVLPIYNCFHPILREVSNDIINYDRELDQFIEDMIETMYKANGIGLAANQVGDRRSVLLVDEKAGEDQRKSLIVMINPRISSSSEKSIYYQEGCLSIPGFFEDINRPEEIEVEYLDRKGNPQKLSAGNLLSRVIQHEIDHLQGKLFIDYLTPLQKALSKSKLNKLSKGKSDAKYPMINPDGSLNEPR